MCSDVHVAGAEWLGGRARRNSLMLVEATLQARTCYIPS